MSNTVGFGFSPNTGKHLENLVFLALCQQTKEIHYYSTPAGYEVDFYLPEKRQLIQVTQNLENPVTRKRKIRTLTDAVQAIKVESALILADANEDGFEINGVQTEICSTAEWLLSQ